MKRNYYIFNSGKLIRRQNTLYFEPGVAEEPEECPDIETDIIEVDDADSADENTLQEEPRKLPRKPLPVEDIEALYCYGELRFNTKFLNFIAQKRIVLHLFNYYGYYSGSFYPREPFISGNLLVNQAAHYMDEGKRLVLAKKFVLGAAENTLKNLQYYGTRERDMEVFIERIDELKAGIDAAGDISELMGREGNIKALYYKAWNLIISENINFEKRIKHPPDNPINALISFGNAMVYTSVLSEIYKTQLNPTISFLHKPGDRRFSLALDIAEIFKPLLADRIIFSLMNKKQISEKSFNRELNFCHLNEEGKKVFVKEYDDKLKTTIKHRQLKKPVSYRRLIRLECYKIIKHLLDEKEYNPFKIWW
jgi:CRISPR-associated protein Cas1